MSVTSKRTKLGNYITKVNNFDIRQLYSMSKMTNGKSQVNSHDIRVCRGGKLIKSGFKTKEQAIEFVNTQKTK